MGDKSKIEWTDASWNPVLGCSKVSPGCQNCYAVGTSHRNEAMHSPDYVGLTVLHPNGLRDWSGKVVCLENRLEIPLRWKRPRRIFVNSMSDLFHKDVPFDFVDKVFGVMAICPQHQFQVLTKRPERMREYFSDLNFRTEMIGIEAEYKSGFDRHIAHLDDYSDAKPRWPLPLPNVWLGTSVENQATADERIPHLLQTPAAVRWLSCEPLLGPVDLTKQDGTVGDERYNQFVLEQAFGDPRELWACPKCEGTRYRETDPVADFCKTCKGTGVGVDWVVCGGESGPNARPMHDSWAISLRSQCEATGVPFFMKQICVNGKRAPMENWPLELQVREYPVARGKHSNHIKASNHYRWNKDKVVATSGYVKIRVGRTHPLADPNGYAYEHLLVWVSAGRSVPPKGMLIHHINEDKHDNRLDNLEMQSRADHNRLHNMDKLRDPVTGRFGKSRAGRLLDNQEHNEYPTPNSRKD